MKNTIIEGLVFLEEDFGFNFIYFKLKSNTNYYGKNCEKTLCENSFCFYDYDTLNEATCAFCSGNGDCVAGECKLF